MIKLSSMCVGDVYCSESESVWSVILICHTESAKIEYLQLDCSPLAFAEIGNLYTTYFFPNNIGSWRKLND
jgi:hypothetical protein